jgi:3-hydroxyisobutyrate dehydrogenase-like beta-hydroxyacid dehydrogenase
VVSGPSNLVGGLAAGTALIDMSTVGPDAVRAVAARLPDGVELLDAPVRGGPTRAAKGELKILLGASDEAAARWTPLLQTLGSVMHVGPPGAGAAAKVLNNFVGVSLVSLLGEAMALADALGIEESRGLELLGSTPIRATLQHQWPRVVSGGKPPSFRLRLAAKDLRLALEAAGRTTDLPMGRAALDWLGAAVDAGLAEHDQSGVIPRIRSRS